MLPNSIIRQIKKEDALFLGHKRSGYKIPEYKPKEHYLHLTKSKYYHALLVLRNFVALACDYYFAVKQGAKKIDLFIITPSISSPMGPGSDSSAIPINFGGLDSYLVDSSQFGFEPLLMNGFDKVFCYLPSMRGEDHDKRHLNQFFHCEAEIKGSLVDLFPVMEEYVKTLCFTLLQMPNIIGLISRDSLATIKILQATIRIKKFPKITFDEAVRLLMASGKDRCVRSTDQGRDITAQGELEIMKILNVKTPLWVMGYDRDRVAFYQKPDPSNTDKVVNADLLFPRIIKDSFGGEVLGCGQRQDCAKEIKESLRRQGLSSGPYEWYIDLRRQKGYKPTSGFGLGIERFLTWALCLDDIKSSIIYPRLKKIRSYP